MNKKPFFFGLLSGVVIAYHWRVIAKEGMKVGIRAGRKGQEILQQAMEDIEDIAAEATEEASEQHQTTIDGGPRG
jgi:gas vesicle protein